MKSLRLFLAEHSVYLVFHSLLTIFILSLYWLDGFRNVDTAVYSVVMVVLLTGLFLAARFINRRAFYGAILRKPDKMDRLLTRTAKSPEPREVERFAHEAYVLYEREVQALYEEKSRHETFMNQWVHQMKTPLSVITLLLQEEEIDRDAIGTETDKIRRGLETVLLTARLGTFERDMHISRADLGSLVREAISDHKKLFISNRVYPVSSVGEELAVTTDPKWMKTIIAQFITNAVKYSPEPGSHVYFTAERTDEGIRLTVRDEGIGIPASDLNRVTKAFFTGENGRLTGESTGMGLFIAKEVCDQLGHPLSIESTPGEGTALSILFADHPEEGRESDADRAD
ncbi:sensor histidine kinase [Edaphobacillus lindanitolerans]|uniref:histidine kinase n=1 Tax=Edaphobacillus lindanitolerans TaxID=550447 RepID=A0A1U7PSC7_9BACI|nr:sensor histidine kinase [Edaphobacillus lindanitolerans]SIT91062.1 Signal transduction histidine kinase [Edaphobacillus lindanitolerans]